MIRRLQPGIDGWVGDADVGNGGGRVPVVPRGIGGGALAEPPAHPTIVDGLGPTAATGAVLEELGPAGGRARDSLRPRLRIRSGSRIV